MKKGIPLKDRARFALGRAKGIPVETDLGPYLRITDAAAQIEFSDSDDEGLARRAAALRTAFSIGTSPDASRAEALALAAEACRRVLKLEPFEGQLAAAVAMGAGRVVQMQTGEGKTLAAALAAVAMALEGQRIHILTANDYLAHRDAEWMGPLYRLLGLSVASIGASSSTLERRAAYQAGVTYLSARELGFDYLRDGLAYDEADRVQLPYSSAIVDEADFILVDEARIPLVIAGKMEGDRLDLNAVDRAASRLNLDLDFRVDPEGREVLLTAEGDLKLGALLGTDESGELGDALRARCFAALHARQLLHRDVDYVVKEGAIRLVDSFTGRIAERRQWPWGIQAALEAKEGLELRPEGRIYSSITVQNLIAIYPRLAAMTATAVPAAEEFAKVYGLATVVVPPNRLSQRVDKPDAVFWDRASKTAAIVDEIARAHASGRPVLVGTASVSESEALTAALRKTDIGCVVLNAKNDEAEARLVAAAGLRGAVTISTNMAGRGTDIRLGDDPLLSELGGLYVIGTSRHESRRVDDQLRGRSGRQGEPGETRFFVSLEDELFRRFGVRAFLPEAYRNAEGSGPIDDPVVVRELERAQAIIEGQNARIRAILIERSRIVEYDRRYLRQLRDEALIGKRLPEDAETALAERHTAAEIEAARPRLVQAFLTRLDAAWADHLALVEDIKEGIGLRKIGGKDPAREFNSSVAREFEDALRRLEETAILDCEDLVSGKNPGASAGGIPNRPSSTWTYIVDDQFTPGFDPGIVSGVAAVAMGPMAFPLFALERIVKFFAKRRRGGRKEG